MWWHTAVRRAAVSVKSPMCMKRQDRHKVDSLSQICLTSGGSGVRGRHIRIKNSFLKYTEAGSFKVVPEHLSLATSYWWWCLENVLDGHNKTQCTIRQSQTSLSKKIFKTYLWRFPSKTSFKSCLWRKPLKQPSKKAYKKIFEGSSLGACSKLSLETFFEGDLQR